MKKVVLSLVVVGLGISGSCSAASDGLSTADSEQKSKVSYYQVKVKPALVKAKVNTGKVLKRKDVQIAVGTAAVIGSGVLAYHYVPSFRGFVDGNASKVANSDMGQKLGEFTKRSGKAIDNGLRYLSKKTGEGYSFVSNKVGGVYKIVSYKVASGAKNLASNVKNVGSKVASLFRKSGKSVSKFY